MESAGRVFERSGGAGLIADELDVDASVVDAAVDVVPRAGDDRKGERGWRTGESVDRGLWAGAIGLRSDTDVLREGEGAALDRRGGVDAPRASG